MSHLFESMSNRVYRLVLTGGPCGGKTTGQARLSSFFESIGWKVYRVPQMLSALTSGGVKMSDCVMSNEASYRFNENLLKLIMQVENTYFEMAANSSENCLVICDGGTMDIKALMSGEQWLKMIAANGWNEVELRDSRYNQVLHMVSIAGMNNSEDCSRTLPAGMDEQSAREVDTSVSQAWVGHPYYDVVDNSTEFDRKMIRMIRAVCGRLNIQIGDRLAADSYKRKFLVRSVPDAKMFPQFQDFVVVHDYLATPNHKMQARIRCRGQNVEADSATPLTPVGCIQLVLDVDIQGNDPQVFIVGTDNDLNNWTYTHTVRCSQPEAGHSPELKMQISAREYELLLAQKDVEHSTIYKTRRCFLWKSQYFQLDIYEEPCPPSCRGVIMLETYTSIKGSEFELPDFLDIIQEVTGKSSFSMHNLSRLSPSSYDHQNTTTRVETDETCSSSSSSKAPRSPVGNDVTKQPNIVDELDTGSPDSMKDGYRNARNSASKKKLNGCKDFEMNVVEIDVRPTCLRVNVGENEENESAFVIFNNEHNHYIESKPALLFNKLLKWTEAKRSPGAEVHFNTVL